MIEFTLNGQEIKEGDRTQDDLFGSDLNIFWDAAPGKYYTLLLIDSSKRRVYALVDNIPGSNLSGGQVKFPLTPEAETRRNLPVNVRVYLQPGPQTFNVSKYNRFNFNENAFAQEYDLQLKDSLNFTLRRREITEEMKESFMVPEDQKKGTEKQLSNERLDKYCRCILDVSSKQTKSCLERKAWGQEIEGKTCYNPYAVCAKSIGTSSGRSPYCGQNYNYEALPDKLLVAYARLNKIEVPEPYNRQTVLKNIEKYKQMKET